MKQSKKQCKYCQWRTKVNEKVSYCLFAKCIKEQRKNKTKQGKSWH